MGYQPIENYGIIGNLHTVALVASNGDLDFMCLPRFDWPSVFAALLDDEPVLGRHRPRHGHRTPPLPSSGPRRVAQDAGRNLPHEEKQRD